MNKLTLAFLIAAFLLLIFPAQATIYVGGGDGAGSLSEAIEKAKENETIIVCEGIYSENVVIDKPLILKASGNVTVEAVDNSATVVWIKANNVVFSDFTVKAGYVGIHLDNVQRCKIENNSVSENDFGIAIISSCSNSIANNTAFNNKFNGIRLQDSSDTNKITNNTACENSNVGLLIVDSEENVVTHNSLSMNLDGIFLTGANKNELRNNTACENSDVGLQIQDSEENVVTHNSLSRNLNGIVLTRANKNELRNNTACENSNVGLKIQQNSTENVVTHNSLSRNLDGIVLIGANKNELRNNTACENSDVGLQIEDSEENVVTHNSLSRNLAGIVLIGANKNKLRNNTACENSDMGLQIQDSEENVVTHNSLSWNLNGFLLMIGANKNELRNNTACENSDMGLLIVDSEENVVTHNSLSRNLNGIVLIGANKNELRNNNLVDSKNYQARVQDSYLNTFNYNYWSDYKAQYPDAQEKSNTGIGDRPYEIDAANKDDHPYLNYSGWLDVVITPEFWEFFTKKGDVNYFYTNFSIENRLHRATNVEVILEHNLEFAVDSDSTEKNRTFYIEQKSTENVTLRLNVTNLEGYILRTIKFKTEDYTKATLVHGLVQPKTNEVKIEGVDYHRNVVLGQINPFNVILRNHGDRDAFEVTLKMGSQEIKKSEYLNENETKTVPFEIDTSDMPLGIIKGQVEVLKSNQLADPPLDHLDLTMFVASELEGSTLIVTNLSRFNESNELRSELIRLTHHPAVNGILLDVSCDYSEFDSNYKANELCEEIKEQIEDRISEYPNIRYLIIVGDDHIIPFFRIKDGTKEVFTAITGLPDEGDYSLTTLPSNSVKNAISTNHFLTDDFYSLSEGRVLAVGRLVEKPDEIIEAVDMFFNYYQLTPANVFVTGYDFMYDGSKECFEAWRKRIGTTFKYKDKKSSNYANPDEIISKIFNSSISAIFLHANYDEFEVPSGISVKREYLGVEEIRALNGSIIYTMGCHAGLTIPEVKDLSQTVLSNGTIAYIAPTGYGLGGVITVAGHEKLLEYLTKRIARGEEVGFAVMNAKNDYYLDNFNQDKLDEKVIRSLTLYGFPMYAVRLDSSITAMGGDAELEEHSIKDLAYTVSNITLEEATLILKPTFKVYETENGTYYSYQDISTEAGMPILPKATWYFIRGEKEIRGIALRSARFEVSETRLAIETFAVSDGSGSENELKGWYPTIPFTLNTIEDRQGIVTASAQYKYTEWPKKGIIRLFNEIVLDIFRVPVDAEKEKPVVNVSIDKGVTVKVEDPAGIYDVLITYLDSENNSWESKSLGHSESERKRVEYSIPLNNTVFFVQAIDVNGNVKIDDNKGRYYVC